MASGSSGKGGGKRGVSRTKKTAAARRKGRRRGVSPSTNSSGGFTRRFGF